MEPRNCNTKRKKYVHLTERDRFKIEGLLEGKKAAGEIAIVLRRDRSTIYREIKRGTVRRLCYDLSQKETYRANVAQADYERQGRNKERMLKIGKDARLEAHIRIKLIDERFSPDAIIGQIKAKGL